ncbi:MAG: mandelate racemase/muconate lactonizing enzyme family protein [Geminicoccaceae bacterium]
MSASRIAEIEARLFAVPLAEPLIDAKHGEHSHFELITTVIRLEDGSEGIGYTYTGGRGGQAIRAMIDHDLAPALIGMDADPVEELNQMMEWHVHYVGRGGIAGFAISALDIALWDLRGRRRGEPLRRLAGGEGTRAKAYRGGIDLGFELEKLVASVRGYRDQGFNAVKIKVGRETLEEDLARVAAVRAAIGPATKLMVDANYALDVEEAIRRAEAFKVHDILWFEEPIIPDDFAGYGRIADATDVPLAMGENLHTMQEFDLAFDQAKLSFIQPDASNCGGITGWLAVAEKAYARGIPICSHGMQELHVSLIVGRKDPGWLEVHSFPIDVYTTRPLVMEDGLAIAPEAPGTGVIFDWSKLAPHEIAQR